MNKYNNPRLLNTVVSGTGMKNPVRPHVIIGSEENGFIRGDLMDANAIQELIVTEIAAREHGDEELTEYIDEKVQLAVDDLVDGAPEVLDTLKELSEALGDDANFATTITEKIASKVDKVEGKGLSTNDYTNAEKQKLAGIAAGAEVNVQSDWSLTNSSNDSFIKNKPTKLSQFTNDVPYATQDYIINNFETKTRVTELKQSIKEKIDNIESVLPKDVESETFVPVASKDDVEELKENLTFTETTDPANGHEYVDLGLPSGTKWATMNVGASSATDYGNYYMYGMGSKTYDSTDTPYSGTEDPLALSADTAAQEWGGDWHMPTQAQMRELTANTTYKWVTDYNGSGINGGLFTAQNGNSVFFPAAGYWFNGSLGFVGSNGKYWGSSPKGSSYACSLGFGNSGKSVNKDYRNDGFSVRGVLDGDAQGETTITPVKEVVTDLKSNEEVIAAALNNLNTKIEATNISVEKANGAINDALNAIDAIPQKWDMDSSTFNAIFTRTTTSSKINELINTYCPTFYVKDSSNGVGVCSVVRSATKVCVFRNKVDEQSGNAIQEFKPGTVEIDGTIAWGNWTNISSTTPRPLL